MTYISWSFLILFSAHPRDQLEDLWRLLLTGASCHAVLLPFWKRVSPLAKVSHFPLGNPNPNTRTSLGPVIKSGGQVSSASGSGKRRKRKGKKWHLFLGWCWRFSERRLWQPYSDVPVPRIFVLVQRACSWLQNSSSQSRAFVFTQHWRLKHFPGGPLLPKDLFCSCHLRLYTTSFLYINVQHNCLKGLLK